MKLPKIFTILLVLGILSCAKQTNFNDELFERVFEINTNDLKESSIYFSDIFTDISYVKLETHKDNLIGNFRKLNAINEKIYITSWDGLFVFNREGEYLFKIAKSGRGPGEFIDASAIVIDTNTIEILDIFQKKVFKYDKKGDFIDDFRLDGINVSAFTKLGSNEYVFYLGNRKHPDIFDNVNFNLIILKDENIINAFYPISPFRENLHYIPLSNFHRHDSITLFQDVFNDTIYKVTSNSFTPHYYINFKEKKIIHSALGDNKDTEDILNEIYSLGLADIVFFNESENFIYFEFIVNRSRYCAIFNKQTNNFKVTKGFINNFEVDQISYPILMNNDKLYFYYEAYDFMARYNKNKNNIDKNNSTQYLDIIKTLTNNDNPVIVEAQIMHF